MNKMRSQSESSSETQEEEQTLIPLTSLRLKARLIAVAISTIPIILIGIATYQVNKRTVNKQIERNQIYTAEIFADKVSNFLLERYTDIEKLAEQAIFIDPQLRANTDIEEKARYLDVYLSFSKGIYKNIVFVDLESDRLAVAGDKSDILYQKKEYLKEALSSHIFISQPQKNNRQELVVIISAPVKDRISDKIIGIVKTSIPVDSFKEIIKKYDRNKNLYLIDNRGQIFANSNLAVENEFQGESIDVNQVFPTIVNTQNQTEKSQILKNQANFEGASILLARANINKIEKLPDLGWYLLVETPAAEAFQAQSEIKKIFAIGTAMTLAIVGTITAIIANLSVKPIEKITTAVAKIAGRDLGVRLTITGKDELSILAANTNRMADKIEKLIETERENAKKFSNRNQIIANLLNLIRNEVLKQGNVRQAAIEFTSAIAKTLELEAVSIWLYNETRDSLTALDRYCHKRQEHNSTETIHAKDFPNYFQDLAAAKLTVVEQLDTPAIAELIAAKQIPTQTKAMLNIPISSSDLTVGILRCEQSDRPRQWSTEDLSFIDTLASLIALALESEYLQNEVEHLLEVVRSIEDGDLTAKAKVSERVPGLVGDALNRLSAEMTRKMAELISTTRSLQQQAKQQKDLATQFASNTDLQAQNRIELLKLNERVQAIAADFARKIEQNNRSLSELESTVAGGQMLLVNLTDDIDILETEAERILQQTNALQEFIALADRFLEEQSEIASLTQVLAMNASLVSARASQLKDPAEFTMVALQFQSIADRVSSLAQQTDRGLVNLERSSTEIHQKASEVDIDIENLTRIIQRFSEAIQKSSQVFANLDAVTEISSASDRVAAESSRSIIDVARSIVEVVEDSFELASETEKFAVNAKKQSENIEQRSKQLLETVEFFQLPPIKDRDPSHSVNGSSPEENSISSLT